MIFTPSTQRTTMNHRSVFTLCLITVSTFTLAQTMQNIRGRVVDEVSKTPLIGVNVRVTSVTELLGAVTDPEGYYTISGVPVGRHTIKFTYVGFEEVVVPDFIVTAGKEAIINVSLTESVQILDAVVVMGTGKEDKTATNNDLAVVSARSFNVDDTKRYAGALGDPSRMAANFAGVVGGNDSRNDIVVRGNSPLGMLWQLEGMNIPNPNHFGALVSTGGPVSMLNNNNLDKSDFLTSAFPAQYGNATAGVFDLRLRDGNTKKYEYLGQIGFNGFEIGAEGPFSKSSKASFIVNYRYSTLGVFKTLGIEFGTGSNTPFYQDLNVKISVPTDKGKWTLLALGGKSSIDLLGSKADLGNTSDLYGSENTDQYPRYKTGIAGISYEHSVSPKTFMKITGGITHTNELYAADSLVRNAQQEVAAKFLKFNSSFRTEKKSVVLYTRTKFNKRNSLTSGAFLDAIDYRLFNQELFANVNKDTTHVDQQATTHLIQAYSTWKHRFNNQWSFLAGVHGQYYSMNNQAVAEPRLSLQYQMDANHSLSLGYGIHHQTQNLYTTAVQSNTPQGVVLSNRKLDFTASQHTVLTYDWNISEHLRLKAEGYYQYLTQVPVETNASSYSALNIGASFAPDGHANLVNQGVGRNYGVELTLERFFSKGFYFLLTQSYFDSRYKGSDGIWRNTAYNTHYVINALAGREWRVGRNKDFLVVNLKFTTIGGKYLTPIDAQKSQLYGQAIYQESLAYSVRQPAYFRMDIKIAYRKEYKHSTLESAIDFQNVTNHQNVFFQNYNPRTNSIVTQYQQAFFPVPYVRYTF
jgi:hypothetical protein